VVPTKLEALVGRRRCAGMSECVACSLVGRQRGAGGESLVYVACSPWYRAPKVLVSVANRRVVGDIA